MTTKPETINIPSIQARDQQEGGNSFGNDFYLCEHVRGDSFPTCKRMVKCLIIILCQKGMIRYEHNDKTMHAKVGDLIILNPEQMVASQQPFYDFEGTVLMVSEKIVPQLPYQQMSYLALKRHLEAIPVISLKQEDLEPIKLNFQLLNNCINRHNNEQSILRITQVLFNDFILSQEKTAPVDGTIDKSDLLAIANRFAELVAENYRKRINVAWCCRQLNYSSAKLVQAVKEYYQITPHEYIILRKLNKSFDLLTNTSYSVKEISERLTFASGSAFCRTFKKHTETTPRHFRHSTLGQQQDIIHHTIPYRIFP